MRGYIAMLAVKGDYRGKGIATRLVRMAIDIMIERDAEEVEDNHSRLSSLCSSNAGCSGNRSHEHGSNEALRETRLSEEQEAPSLLPQWEFSLPLCSLRQRKRCYPSLRRF